MKTPKVEQQTQPGKPSKEQPKPKWREEEPSGPVLRFSPTAWAKLLFFRDRGQTEIGGFAITREHDLLYVEEFMTVKQNVSMVSVAFEDEAVADFFDSQVDVGRKPEQFGRIWLHTHPGNSPEPSATDEETFSRVFGRCQWAVMFILARNGKVSARLRFSVGPGGQLLIPVEVDYSEPFGPSNQEAWEKEYQANINPEAEWLQSHCFSDADYQAAMAGYCVPQDWIEELESMDPFERREMLAELTGCSELWEEGEGNEP